MGGSTAWPAGRIPPTTFRSWGRNALRGHRSRFGIHAGTARFVVYVAPEALQPDGPVTALLGDHGAARSLIETVLPVTYLVVPVRAGERWTFEPAARQTLARCAIGDGAIEAGAAIRAGEIAVFEPSQQSIEFRATSDDALLVVGAAAPVKPASPRIGRKLRAQGRPRA